MYIPVSPPVKRVNVDPADLTKDHQHVGVFDLASDVDTVALQSVEDLAAEVVNKRKVIGAHRGNGNHLEHVRVRRRRHILLLVFPVGQRIASSQS
jgi:hypothetical protein